MNWCGCTNYLSTGHYDHMSPFLCASERAAVATAGKVYQHLESLRPGIFSDHLAGLPAMASRTNLRKEAARPNLEFHNL